MKIEDIKNKYPDDVTLVYENGKVSEFYIRNINDQITTLDCNYCPNLKSLPNLPNLKTLECYYCPVLSFLPEYPNLKNLYCYDCFSLTTLPNMPNLKYLDCSNCTSLTTMPEFPNLENLDCSCCRALTTLPELLNLEHLNCYHCRNLQSLPEFLNLKSVNCTGCINLKTTKENYQKEFVNNILKNWQEQDLVPYDEERGYLFWKCVTPDLRGNLNFQYEVGTEFKNSGMACPGPFGALRDFDANKNLGSRVMAFYAKTIYPVDIKKGIYHTLQGTPVAIYLVTDFDFDGFTPTLIMGEEDDNIKKVLYGE